MTNINLLPWRAELRAQEDKKMLVSSVVFWAVCLLTGFLAVQYISHKLDNQQARNQFLTQENLKLKKKIKDIEKLQAEKLELISRIDVIQKLQQDRMQVVHVFDDVVHKLPSGVTVDSMKKSNKVIKFKGRAESNSTVSNLMNQLDTSKWFGGAKLSAVNIIQAGNTQLSSFDLAVTEKKLVDKKKNPAVGVN